MLFTNLDFEDINTGAAVALSLEESFEDDPRDLRFSAKSKSKKGHDRVDKKALAGIFHRSNESRSMERSKVARRGRLVFA